ncbi:MAG: hypothetical protein F6J86_38445, partial [Symploca sp. SIO1B1]|nr:hypothetical protein [Symploca sp. SIO1B1]
QSQDTWDELALTLRRKLRAKTKAKKPSAPLLIKLITLTTGEPNDRISRFSLFALGNINNRAIAYSILLCYGVHLIPLNPPY